MKCNDCGKQDYECGPYRADICPKCWDLRGQLVAAMQAGKFSQAEFQSIQRKIANSHGSGRGDGLEALNDIYAQVRDLFHQCQQLDELLPHLKAKHAQELYAEVSKLAYQFINP